MIAKVVYKNEKDRDLLNLVSLRIPFFVEYINIDTVKGKKEGWKLMNYYGTSTFPFVELSEDSGKLIECFWSERGNAIQQFISFIQKYNMIVKIKKLNPEAKIPSFKHVGDGAQDVKAVSCKYNPKYDRFEYGLGFATAIPVGYRARIVPRSSNTKTDAYLPNSEGLIDSNYRGEWFVFYKLRTRFEDLFPTGDRELNLLEMENELAPYKVGDMIAQCYIEKVEPVEWEEVEDLDETDRGADGGLVRDDKNFKA